MERLTQISKQLGDNTKDFWESLPKEAIIDDNMLVGIQFRKDPSPNKIYLNASYKDDNGNPHQFEAINKAEKLVLKDETLDKEYSPFQGDPFFVSETEKLIYGPKSALINSGKIITAGTSCGTHSLRLACELVYETLGRKIAIGMPTYGNHVNLFKKLEIVTYPYLDSQRKFNLKSTLEAIRNLKPKETILIHACAHNPTGIDPVEAEWREIAQAIKNAGVVPVIDLAFPGMATGSLDKDRIAIDIFAEYGLNMIIAQTYSKIMGMPGQGKGAISVVCSSQESAEKVKGAMKAIVESMHLTPNIFPERVVARVLSIPDLRELWEREIKEVYDGINYRRDLLYKQLSKKAPNRDWSSIPKQVGMYCQLPLQPSEVKTLMTQKHVYLLPNGRVTMGSFNTKNIDHITTLIADVVNKSQQAKSEYIAEY